MWAGVIKEEDALILQSPESFWARFRAEVRLHHEVTRIDTQKKTVTVRHTQTGKVSEERYDKLVLSPGARPAKPALPGLDNDRISPSEP